MIRHRVDIEKNSAGQMRGEKIVIRQRQHARQLEAGVDNFHVAIVEWAASHSVDTSGSLTVMRDPSRHSEVEAMRIKLRCQRPA